MVPCVARAVCSEMGHDESAAKCGCLRFEYMHIGITVEVATDKSEGNAHAWTFLAGFLFAGCPVTFWICCAEVLAVMPL